MFDISDIAHTLSRRLDTETPYPLCAANISAGEAQQIGKEYCDHAFSASYQMLEEGQTTSTFRTTDKMPTNFWHLGLIASILPEASIVHVERNPMDVCLSCFKQNLTWPFCDLDAIVPYLEGYREMMRFWKKTLPTPIHTIHYEDLVAATESETKRLLEFCGLDWDQRCLQVSSTTNAIRTPSKWQVRQPIYSTSISSWKRYESQLTELHNALREKGFDVG